MKIIDLSRLTFKGKAGNQVESVSSGSGGDGRWWRDWFPNAAQDIHITQDNAMQSTSVYRCVKLIADTIAGLPLHVRLEGERQKDDYRYLLLKNRPNPQLSKFTFFQTLISNKLLWGNAYVEIIKDSSNNEIKSLRIIHPSNIKLMRSGNDFFYEVKIGSEQYHLPEDRIAHFKNIGANGWVGQSAISIHRKTLTLGAQMEQFGQDFFESSASDGGYLFLEKDLSQESWDRIQQQMNEKKSKRGVRLIQQGLKFERNSIPPEDAQFLQSRVFQVSEIARIFGVPPILLFEQSKNTSWGSGIEQTMIAFLQFTLMPIMTHIEEELNYKLFSLEEQANDLQVKFAYNGLLRGDTAARTAYYQAMFNVGALSRNEIRGYEDLPKLDDGDDYFMQLNMATVADSKAIKQEQKQNA